MLALPVLGVSSETDEEDRARSAQVGLEVQETDEGGDQGEDASRSSDVEDETSVKTPEDANVDAIGRMKCEQLERDRTRKKDAVTIGASRTIKAGEVVSGDAVVVGGNLKVHGSIVGDAVCVGGRMQVGPEAVVCGELVTVGGISEVDPDAYIKGQKVAVGGLNVGPFKILRHLKGWDRRRPHHAAWSFDLGERFVELVSEVVLLLFMLFVGFLTTVFLPRQMDRIKEHLAQDFPRSALLGVGMMILVPVMAAVLLVTCIGIPFLPLLALAVVVTGTLGYIAFGHVLGQRLLGASHEMAQIFAGLLLLQGASILGNLIALPGGTFQTIGVVFDACGQVIFLGAATIGLGAVVYSRFGKRTLAESQTARKRNDDSAPRVEAP
ncbi:MAG: hypothetical protein JXO72_06100 [Vicinamibacteria bacterium]|nr:hypothetical protein [Vicinamibacteria bacterium]